MAEEHWAIRQKKIFTTRLWKAILTMVRKGLTEPTIMYAIFHCTQTAKMAM